MTKTFRRLKHIMKTMTHLPSCCLLTSAVTLVFVSMATIDFVHATGQTTTTTTEKPFLESTMFVGLAAGIGGFFAFAILCCILWKCCCGSKD